MCQFVETIRIKDGVAMNTRYHIERLNKTRNHFWPSSKPISESELLTDIPQVMGLQKARVVYDASGITLREYHAYTIRDVKSICVVEDNMIDYTWKSTDRNVLTAQRDKAPKYDEVIIIKNGKVTDTSYTNLCFYDGQHWLTPDTPLLKGTMRQHLLDEGKIIASPITKKDIASFEKVALINAMMDLGDLILPISSIDFTPLRI